MKNVITYLKTLWRRGLGSQSSDVSLDCRLTVGSPSVKCGSTLMRLVAISAFLLTIGVGNVWGAASTETFDFSSGSYNSTDQIITWTGTSCTIVQSKGGSNTAVNSSYTGANLRWYASHDVTFTPKSNITITSIVLVGAKSGSNKYYGQTMTEQSSTSAIITNTTTTTTTVTGSWTPSTALTLRMGSQFRLTSVTITYCKTPSATSNGTITSSSAVLNWTDAAETNDYQLYWSTSSTPPTSSTVPSVSSGVTSTTYTISSGLTASTTYHWWVRSACSATSQSSWKAGSSFTTASAASVAVTGVTVAPTSKTIFVGETFDITPTVAPANATNKNVSWSSSASGKASVNSSGVVTGVAAGSANITCTTTDGSFTATCATTVYSASVTSIVDEDGTDISASGVTATISGRTLTASEGSTKYKFKTWKYGTASGTSISSATSLSTTLSGTPTGNVTLIAEFYKPVEVAWTKGGTTYSTGGPTTSVKRGTQWKDLTIPTAPGDASLGSCADKFMGWSNCSDMIGTGHSAPGVLFTSVSGITTEITTPIEFKAVFATAGAGGAGEKIKITPTNSELPAAGKYNGSATSFTIGDYTFKHNSWCKSADPPSSYSIQAKKNIDLSVYNVTTFENKIDHIIVYQTGTNRDVTITGSYYYDDDEATADGGTYEEEAITPPSTAATMNFSFTGKNHRYFYMSTPGNAVYMDSIVVYTRSSITYSDYVTKCCTPLGYIGGSVEFTDPTTAVLTWNAMSNVDATTPYTITYRTGSDDFDDDNVGSISTNGAGKKTCTITGLSCNTSYDFKIEVTAASNYCDKDTTMTGKNSGTWSVTSTIVNGTKTDVPTTACGDYEAEFAASDGYHFPAKANVSVTGASDFSWNSSTGVLTISGANITGNITISITCPPDACSDWGFYYGTDGQSDWAYECFTKVKPADATDHEWLTDVFALPNKPNWYVDNSTENDGKKVLTTWSNLYFAASQGDGARPMVGTATGATGKIRIYDNSNWNNRYAGFIPDGYKLKFGTDYSPFTLSAGNTYYSDIVTYNSSNANRTVAVGVINANSSNAYVSTGNTQEMRHIFLNTGGTDYWGKDNISDFGLYDITNSSFTCLMVAVPGESNLYEGWVPSTCESVIFVRLKSTTLAWGDANANVYNQTVNIDLASDKSVYTIDTWNYNSTGKSSGTWSAYTRKGKFRIDANYADKNWYVRFKPHYVLHFDANSGSGAPDDQSVALDADPCQLTVSSTAPTRSNYTFLGWNESSSATTPDGDWDGGDTHAMTGDVTLYAVWAANHTLTYSYNGGDGSSCSGGTKYTGESFTACSSAGDKEGHTFTGWLGSNSVSYTAGSSYSMPDADLTLTAQWNADTYTISYKDQGNADYSGSNSASLPTSHTYGAATDLVDGVRSGYRFDGWFDNSTCTGSAITSIGATDITTDKTYYAKWTKVHTVTWKVNGSTYKTGVVSGNSQVANGEQISAMATAPANNTLSCSSKFMGWSVTNIPAGTPVNGSSNISALGLFTTVGSSPTITKDTVFYAVFAKQTNSDGYKYIGDAGTLADGEKYIFVDSKTAGSGHALKASDLAENSSAGKKGTAVSVSITSNAEGILITTENSALEFEYVSTGTKLKYADGLTTKYLFINGNGVGYKTGDSRSAYGTHQLYGWTNGYANRYVYYDGTNENFTISEDAQNMYAYIKQTPVYGDYRVQCDPNIVTVTYDGNSGSTTCENEEHDKRNDYTVCSSAPTRDYYTFAGWLCSADSKTYAASATIDDGAIDDNFTLTAQWTPVSYSISYNLNGGTNAADPISAYNVETTSALPTPTKGHDRFDGWYTDDGVWSNQVSSITAGMHGNLTLYAKWTSRYEIVFDVYGGSTTTIYRAADENLESAVAGQGSKPSDPDAPSTCSTKTFVGWVESEIDDETDTKPATLTNATGAATADKHYYATWALKSGSDIDAAEDNSFTTSGTETYCGMTNGMKDAGDYILKNSVWSTDLSGSQVKIKVYHLSNNSSDVLRISLINSSGTEVVGTDLTTTALGGSNTYAAYSAYVTLTPTSTVTGYKVALKTKNSYGTCVDKVTREVVATYSKYATSCCGTKVTLSGGSPENGTVTFAKSSLQTCDEDKTVKMTITPSPGYQLATYSVATGDGKVATKSMSADVDLNNNSSAAQEIDLTFAEDANGAYNVTATFTLMTVTSWTWTLNSADIPDPLNLYVGQSARLDVAYTPSGVDASKKTYTRTKDNDYINWGAGAITNYSTIIGKASTGANTTAVTFTHADGPTKTVNVKVKPLPLVHFEDNVHGVAFADVVATLTDNALTDDGVDNTPTHDDFDGSTANTCEEEHLHLVGWIDGAWPAYAAYMAGTGDKPSESAIVGATGYFYLPGAEIDLVAKDGHTYYAIWAKVE